MSGIAANAASTVPTLRVKDTDAGEGYIVINKEDFDSSVHEIYVEPKEVAAAVVEPAAEETGKPARKKAE